MHFILASFRKRKCTVHHFDAFFPPTELADELMNILSNYGTGQPSFPTSDCLSAPHLAVSSARFLSCLQ